MIIIAIEHCNGEIMNDPIIITQDEVKEYLKGEYLIYAITLYNNKIREIKNERK